MINKTEWGPVVWRLLHAIADISYRKDIYLLWSAVLRCTAHTLPCDACRMHMKLYLQTHPFVPKTWMSQTGKQNRDQIRVWMHTFHNSVNERLGKPVISLSELPELGFQDSIQIIQEQYRILMRMWGVQKALFGEWRRNMELLIKLVSSGSDV